MSAFVHVLVTISCILHLQLNLVSSQSSICVWGRSGYNSDINGRYTISGTFRDKPTYEKVRGCWTLYIWWDDGDHGYGSAEWHIDSSVGSDYRYAHCNASNITDCNVWNVWNIDDWEVDNAVTVYSDSCPSLDCDQVHIPSLYNECDEPFPISLGDNAWTNEDRSRYLWFSPFWFQWVCDREPPGYDPGTSCSSSYVAYSAKLDQWISLSEGESTATFWSGTEYSFECIDYTTTPPSVTLLPSFAPFANPTATPTATPTVDPSVATTDSTRTVSITAVSTTSNDEDDNAANTENDSFTVGPTGWFVIGLLAGAILVALCAFVFRWVKLMIGASSGAEQTLIRDLRSPSTLEKSNSDAPGVSTEETQHSQHPSKVDDAYPPNVPSNVNEDPAITG